MTRAVLKRPYTVKQSQCIMPTHTDKKYLKKDVKVQEKYFNITVILIKLH